MKILYIDGNAGVSGDMLLAALLDLTGARKQFEDGLVKLGLPGYRLVYPPRRRGGVEAVGVEVVAAPDAPHFADNRALAELLARATLSSYVRNYAAATFNKLAEAEERAHRVAAGHQGFHEVGAVDAVVDIIGTFLLLELVGPDRVIVSPLRLGFGAVDAAHGSLPIPAPATVELVRGIPTFAGEIEGEFTTPTGAALVATFADRFGPMPTMKIDASGYGPGSADPPGIPNVLRVFLGETETLTKPQAEGGVTVLEANIDDMTAEEMAYAAEVLTTAGALDVSVTPTLMKKGRAAYILKLITRPDDADRFADLVLAHTTTLGVRYHQASRKTVNRRVVTVATEYGAGKVKVSSGPGGKARFHAEYESAAVLAARAGVPLREVARALEAAAAAQFGGRATQK